MPVLLAAMYLSQLPFFFLPFNRNSSDLEQRGDPQKDRK